MTPADPRLHDFLNRAAIAVNEAESLRPAMADAAWLEAHASADGLFAPGTPGAAAVGVILAASVPEWRGPSRSVLWNALDAAAKAALAVMDGRPNLISVNLNGAMIAASSLPGGTPEVRALGTVLAVIAQMAEVTL